ncbi:unnamed protein product [Clonostachys rhizophaga]|uniref:Dipeptidylpeptidase IV N-terminal domain-containing protein n=1 Tax=Clonostachys rhizophaga TaxID=160324 RepID=A0A9N9V9Y8_9HYPO|nr:unnamed protein product [Clonostachys rhizophaga]
MRVSIASTLGLLVTGAIAECPYAKHQRGPSKCPYASDLVLFTSERRADGQSDIYRIKPDGTGLETLVETDSFEDSGSLSPDGSKLAYISTTMNYTANVFVKDLHTGATHNFTGSDESVINFAGINSGINYTASTETHQYLNGSMRNPSWSPDGTQVVYEVY